MPQSIHFVTRGPTNRGGHVVLTNIVRELARRGYLVSIMSWHEDGKPLYPNCKELWEGLPVTIGKLPSANCDEERFCIEQEALRAHLKKVAGQHDFIILDSWLVTLAGIHAGIHTRPEVFQLLQSDAAFQMEDFSKCWKAELFSLIPRVPMKRLAVSSNMVQVIEKRYQQKAAYLPLFIDRTFHEGTFQVKEETQLRIMSSAATFVPEEKGLERMLQTLSRIKGYSFTLTLVTGAKISHDFSQYAFPVQQVHAATPKEMVHIMQQHDAYICPSVKEAFGLAQAEAIALGMPVVAMDAVGNRDFINGENALLATSDDDFVEKIRSLFDSEKRLALHQNAKESMAPYQLDQTVETFIKHLNDPLS